MLQLRPLLDGIIRFKALLVNYLSNSFGKIGFWGIFAPLSSLARGWNGPVAQLNRVFDYGSKGFRFES